MLAVSTESAYPKGISQSFLNKQIVIGQHQLSYQVDRSKEGTSETALLSRFSLEVYQAFMTGYVRRINDATLGVTIGGVRIGSARYTRLAQINLKSRIITFSRYAIENVPERGRRYLVIHELAHVKEPSHNKKFWQMVERHEPNYKQVGRELELAFKRNVKEEQIAQRKIKVHNPLSGRLEEPKLLLTPGLFSVDATPLLDMSPDSAAEDDQDDFLCNEDEFSEWGDSGSGIIHGGSELDIAAANLT